MTLIHSQVAQFTFTFIDDDGAKGQVSFNGKLPALNQWTQDALDKVKEELYTLLTPLLDAALTGVSVVLPSYDDAYPVPPAYGDTENKGVYLMTAEGNQKSDFALPGIKETVLISSGATQGIQIDFSNADVIAFNAAMTAGIDLNPFGILDTVRFGTTRGEMFQQIRDAYKQNRPSLKSRGRRG